MKKKIGDYSIQKTIGKGTFGLVKQGIHLPTGEKVAIKILEKAKILDQKDIKNIVQELSILKRVNHPNIIKLYELIETEKKIYIVTEYVDGGELYQNIITQGKLDPGLAKSYFYQIVQGIKYLHQNGIVHRDLKPENIIIDGNQTIKIIDFGLGREYQTDERLKTSCGSPCYAAPEMISGSKYVPLFTDIWSSGIILYAMVCGYLPFEDSNYKVLYAKVLRGKYETPEWVSDNLKRLLAGILNTDPSKRFCIQEIEKHEWLKGVSVQNHSEAESRIRQLAYPLVQRALDIEPQHITHDLQTNTQSTIQLYLHLYMKQIGKSYKNRSKTLLDKTQSTNNRKRIISQVHSKLSNPISKQTHPNPNPKPRQTQYKGLIHLNYLYQGSEQEVISEIKRQSTQHHKENTLSHHNQPTVDTKGRNLHRLSKDLFYLQVGN